MQLGRKVHSVKRTLVNVNHFFQDYKYRKNGPL